MVAQGVFATGNLRSYCGVEEVLGVLSGCDLSPYGEAAAIEERIKQLLPISRSIVDQTAGRDFLLHAAETVAVDGSGTDRLSLAEAGVWPPTAVLEVRVAGRVLPAAHWKSYPGNATVRLTEQAKVSVWPVGVGNVNVTLDYGEASVPAEVQLVQAKLAAAELLAEISGEGGVVTETRIGDYSVRYAEGGRFAGVIRGLCEQAQATLQRYRRLSVRAV